MGELEDIRQYFIKVRIINYWAKLLSEDDCKLIYSIALIYISLLLIIHELI